MSKSKSLSRLLRQAIADFPHKLQKLDKVPPSLVSRSDNSYCYVIVCSIVAGIVAGKRLVVPGGISLQKDGKGLEITAHFSYDPFFEECFFLKEFDGLALTYDIKHRCWQFNEFDAMVIPVATCGLTEKPLSDLGNTPRFLGLHKHSYWAKLATRKRTSFQKFLYDAITSFPYRLHMADTESVLTADSYGRISLNQEIWFEAGKLLNEQVFATGKISVYQNREYFSVSGRFAAVTKQEGRLQSIFGLLKLNASYHPEAQTWGELYFGI